LKIGIGLDFNEQNHRYDSSSLSLETFGGKTTESRWKSWGRARWKSRGNKRV